MQCSSQVDLTVSITNLVCLNSMCALVSCMCTQIFSCSLEGHECIFYPFVRDLSCISPDDVCLHSYASDVTSGLSDGYEGLSDRGSKFASRRTAGKLFRRRTRSRLHITGVRIIIFNNPNISSGHVFIKRTGV